MNKDTVYCSNCGQQLQASDNFCTSCGSKQLKQEKIETTNEAIEVKETTSTSNKKCVFKKELTEGKKRIISDKPIQYFFIYLVSVLIIGFCIGEAFIGTMFLLLIIGFFPMIPIAYKNQEKLKKLGVKNELEAVMNEIEEQMPKTEVVTKFHKMESISEFYLDEQTQELSIIEVNKINYKVFKTVMPFECIIGFDVQSNGQTVTKGTLGAPIVGSLLFGGAGMITGGVIGKKKSVTQDKIEALLIRLNDFENPNFYSEVPNFNSPPYNDKVTLESLEKICTWLKIILENNSK